MSTTQGKGNPPSARPRHEDKDVVLDRDHDGNVHASLPRSVRHYGIEVFDWGYIGPAAAELALNILAWILPVGVDGEPGIRCEQGECSAIAWRLHRSFMAEFLVRVPYDGGCLREAAIRRWVLGYITEKNAMQEQPVSAARAWLSQLMPR